jgi:hypothetical protein
MADRLAQVQNDIDTYGWHVILVSEDGEGPGFAYSIGLHRTLRHPEVVIFGLDLAILHRLVNDIAAEVRRGERFGEGDTSDEILEGYPVAFRGVSAEFYEEYLGQAIRYYGGTAFPALQCFWPDREGRFPWQSGYGYGVDQLQPQLQLPV